LTPRRIVIDQDIFQVLVEANMPAVLLELAFVTNPNEYKYLSSDAGQNEIASRLFKAFKSYKTAYDASVSVTEVPQATAVTKPVEQKQVAQNKEPAVNKPETYYGIQIMGLGRLLKSGDPAFKGLDIHPVKGESSNIYRYIYGKYDTIGKAKEALPTVRKKFPEAFPVQVIGTEVKRVK
jgi:N-acetylmuramoyl-L-alanine amidase